MFLISPRQLYVLCPNIFFYRYRFLLAGIAPTTELWEQFALACVSTLPPFYWWLVVAVWVILLLLQLLQGFDWNVELPQALGVRTWRKHVSDVLVLRDLSYFFGRLLWRSVN